jgi:hypothetical protein
VESSGGFRQYLERDVRGESALRIPLDVPYEEQDDAQRLGARLDRSLRIWYVPAGIDARPFWRWITAADETRIRNSGYSLAQASVSCWKCHKKTDVYALFVPSQFEYRSPQSHGKQWRQSPLPTILSYVTDILPEIADQVSAITKHFRLDTSKGKGQTYWMNHCASCGSKIGDFGLHREAIGPFFAAHSPGTSTVGVLYTFPGRFECKGDVSFGGDDLFYVALEERHYSA